MPVELRRGRRKGKTYGRYDKSYLVAHAKGFKFHQTRRKRLTRNTD